jgi:protein-tyrosine kinase
VRIIDKILSKFSSAAGRRKMAPVRAVPKPLGPIVKDRLKPGQVYPIYKKKSKSYTARMMDGIRKKISRDRPKKPPAPAPRYSKLMDPLMEDRVKAGWVSPVYSRSRVIQVDVKAALENRCVAMVPDMPEAEPYKVLRAQVLQRNLQRHGNTVMVTSALPGEGKTLTAINLGLTFARHYNQTALLVDCDLRNPSIHRYLGLPGEKGLVDYLLDGVNISDLIIWPSIEKFTVLSGGRPFAESGELLGSPRMKEVLVEMKGRYPDRYVIFDVPPILSCADALSFAHLVDSIVVVVQVGRTPIEDVKKALEQMPKEKVLGLVLNRQKTSTKDYYPYAAYPGKR